MNRILLTSCFLLFLSLSSFAQQDTYWVFFADKGDIQDYREINPLTLLSPEAIAIRKAKGIGLNEMDFPVLPQYIHELKKKGIEIHGTSKWLNAVVVSLTAENSPKELVEESFITKVQKVQELTMSASLEEDGPSIYEEDNETSTYTLDYGRAGFQNNMINIAALHQKGFTGRGVRVAIFDAGFSGADTISAFDSLWMENRIIAHYDFVDKENEIFSESSHGTKVLSTIGANLPGEMVGTAPHASFILCRTEDASSETRKEEYNWVAAMEWADSIGVDVIHSSLGYSTFDTKEESYTYEQLDGNQTIISRAADLAAARGIIVTTSAGNEGSGSWNYITAPCDADSVLCIGAVDRLKKRSRFSSYGPSSDGQVKPDVVAMGSRTIVVDQRGIVTSGNGTSFSSPIIAGLVACLVQSHPKRTNMDVIQAIRMSGNNYTHPDDSYGYGIPDAAFADSLLRTGRELEGIEIEEVPPHETSTEEKEKPTLVEMTQNPKSSVRIKGNQIFINAPHTIFQVQLMFGKQKVILDPSDIEKLENEVIINSQYLLKGDYYIKIETDSYSENIAFTI